MLQMGKSRHDYFYIGFGLCYQIALQTSQIFVGALNFVSEEKTSVNSHLIIPTSAGVKFASHFTHLFYEPLLDGHVHVFLRFVENKSTVLYFLQNLSQPLNENILLLLTQKSLLNQHAAMSHATFNIITVESLIEPDRCGEAIDQLVGWFSEPTMPQFSAHSFTSRSTSRLAVRTYALGSLRWSACNLKRSPKTLMKPSASLWS